MNTIYRLLIAFSLFLLVSFAYVGGLFDSWLSSPKTSSAWVESNMNQNLDSNTNIEPSASNVSNDYYTKVQDLETYLEQNPTDTTHLLRLARLYSEAHQLNKAIQTYEAYRRLRPEELQTYLDLANLYGTTGNWSSALEITDVLLQVSPNHSKAQYNKAAILANMGKIKEAQEQWTDLAANSTDSTIIALSRIALDKLSVQRTE